MKLQVPEGYMVQRLLGKGGMGQVFLATQTATGRAVALKVLTTQGSAIPEALRRFRREAEVQSSLDHPNVVGLYDFSFESEPPYLALEYVEGRDLESLLESQGKLPLETVLRVARDLSGALDLLHGRGLLHRDLKPSNIMVRRSDDSAVLMDLGLVRVEDGTVMTATGQLVGTPLYLPPELLGEGDWSPRGDQYQFGAVLFELLTGYTLLGGEDLTELCQNLAAGRQRGFPVELELPEHVRQAILRSVSPDPVDRFDDCRQFLEALTGRRPVREVPRGRVLTGGMPVVAPGSGPSSGSGRRARLFRLGVPFLLVLLGLAVGFFPGGDRGGPQEVTWRVVGDVVEVRFLPGRSEEVRLEIGDRVVREARSEGEHRVLSFRGLPSGETLRARLVWRGGEGLEVPLEAAPRLFPGSLRLLPDRRVALRTLRPCIAYLEGATPRETLQPAGEVVLALPPGDAPLPPLVWLEEGLEFRRDWSWEEIQSGALEGLAAAPEDADHAQVLGDLLQGRPSEALGAGRELFRPILPWFQEILAGPLPQAARLTLWNRWQVLERYQFYEVSLVPGARPLSLTTTPRNPGFRREIRSPPREGRGPRLLPPRGRDEVVFQSATRELFRSNAMVAVRSQPFTWPALPEGAGPVEVVAEFRKWRPEFVLRLEPASGEEGLVLDLWNPWHTRRDERFTGWTSLVFPRGLGPAPGTPMRARVLSRHPEDMDNCRLIELWLQPAR